MKYTSCCASPGGPIFQFRKLAMGLRCSPCIFTELMNDILREFPDGIRSHIECIMDDSIIFTPNIEIHMKVIKAFLSKLKQHGLLLTLSKLHTFRSEVKYMGLKMSNANGITTTQPFGSRVKAISTLPMPKTLRGIKSFIGCILYLALFLPHLSKLVKPINDIIKKSNQLNK